MTTTKLGGHPSDPTWAFDEEGLTFNLDTLPPNVLSELLRMRRAADTFRKGVTVDHYYMYLGGVADALYMNRDELDTAIKEELTDPDHRK